MSNVITPESILVVVDEIGARYEGGRLPDMKTVAEDLGYSVLYGKPKGLDGAEIASFFDPETNTILVNKGLHENERILSIAQQMGLHILYPDYCQVDKYHCIKLDDIYTVKSYEEERDGDYFAGKLIAKQMVSA